MYWLGDYLQTVFVILVTVHNVMCHRIHPVWHRRPPTWLGADEDRSYQRASTKTGNIFINFK